MAVQGLVKEDSKLKTKVPKQYKVVMYNDDFTPMDFVVEILMGIFGKQEAEAVTLMYQIHQEGSAIVGTYTYDIAKTRENMATIAAREEGYPLRVLTEEV